MTYKIKQSAIDNQNFDKIFKQLDKNKNWKFVDNLLNNNSMQDIFNKRKQNKLKGLWKYFDIKPILIKRRK